MFDRIKRYILKCAVIVALKKPAPRKIPLTSDGAKRNDCFIAEVRQIEGDYFDLQIDAISQGCFVGREMELSDAGIKMYSKPASKQIDEIGSFEFKAYHYYGRFRFDYSSPLKFVVVNAFKLFLLQVLLENIRQFFFSISTKERTERIEILIKLLEMQNEAVGDDIMRHYNIPYISAIQLFKGIYGERIFNSTQYKVMLLRFQMVLRSFIESGEISENAHMYRVEPFALSTIAAYQVEDRRHKEQMAHNRWIMYLTIVVAASAAYSAFSANG